MQREYDIEMVIQAIKDSPIGLSLPEINELAGKNNLLKRNNYTVVNSLSAIGVPIFSEAGRYYIHAPEPRPSSKSAPSPKERLPEEPLIRHILRNGIGGNDIELLKGGFYGI